MPTKRRPFKTEEKSLVKIFTDKVVNNKILSVPIGIVLILSAAATTLQPIRDLVKDFWPGPDPAQATSTTPGDTLQKPQVPIPFEPRESTAMEPATDGVNLPQRAENAGSRETTTKKIVPAITLNMVPIGKAPFPVIRATFGNKSGTPYTIKAVKIYTDNMLKSRELPEAKVLETTTEWVVPLDTAGAYTLLAKKHLALPRDAFGVIDLVFVYKSGEVFYAPSEIGQFIIHLSFITDADDEIAYPYEITF